MIMKPMIRRKGKVCLSLTLAALLLLNVVPLFFIASITIVEAQEQYYVPIQVINNAIVDLVDYQIKIILNSTFEGWDKFASTNGSDIYFLDTGDHPLYYWIENFDTGTQQATIWVKVPYVEAGSNVTILMYFGVLNHPYTTYHDPEKVFLFYDDFSSGTLDKWDDLLNAYVEDGKLNLDGATNAWIVKYANWQDVKFEIEYEFYRDGTYGARLEMHVRHRLVDTTVDRVAYVIEDWRRAAPNTPVKKLTVRVAGSGRDIAYLQGSYYSQIGQRYFIALSAYNTSVKGYDYNDQVHLGGTLNPDEVFSGGIYLKTWDSTGVYIYWVRVRSYVEPEPSVLIGSIYKAARKVNLPSESLILKHDIAYSPNSTQFTHTFTATNTTTAGYETDYTNIYGWRVYANPYQSGGTSYENSGSLVSEVNITLPYAEVLVENVTLFAKTNGTGSFRQLWIKVLNSTGNVVAELTNVTLSTSWTEFSLEVDASLSGQVIVWINATVSSTDTVGEELAIRDVKINVVHEASPVFSVTWLLNLDFPCTASYTIELGSSELLNSSVLTFKLIEFLFYNYTDYPIQPVYIGNETIGSYEYRIYRIDPANYSQSMVIHAMLENKFKTFRTHVKGYDTDTILVGEPLTIELPELGNLTIVETNQTFINVTSVTLLLPNGTFTIYANSSLPSQWKLGYGMKLITVKYGAFDVILKDKDGIPVSYETLTMFLINASTGELIGQKDGAGIFTWDNLVAGNYSLLVRHPAGVDLVSSLFELNSSTTDSVLNIGLNALRKITNYASRWSIPFGEYVSGAISVNFTRIDSETVEDVFSEFALRFSINDISFRFGETLIPIVNGTPVQTYNDRIMVLYPAKWGYVVLFWKQEGFIALTVSRAWGENILITAINGTFAVSKTILNYVSTAEWGIETNGVETEDCWIIPPGKYVHIWNYNYTKGEVEGIGFSNIPPYGHVSGLTILLNMTNTDTGAIYYVGTEVGKDRIFYTTPNYVSVATWSEGTPFTLFGFKTRWGKRNNADYKELFHIQDAAAYLSFPYMSDPHTGTWKAFPEAVAIGLYETEDGYGLVAKLEGYTTVPKEKRYDAWFFTEFKIRNETAKTIEAVVGVIVKPVVALTNYQAAGATHAFDVQAWLGSGDDFSVKEKYNGAWSSLASGSPYNYQDGYWAIYGEKNVSGTTYRMIAWLDKVFLGDKGSLTPQAWALYGSQIGIMVKEFDGTLNAGVEYGWVAKRIISASEEVKQDVPSPTASTNTSLVKDKFVLTSEHPTMVLRPKIFLSDSPFNLTDLAPKYPLSKVMIETTSGASIIIDYSAYPPTKLAISGGNVLSYDDGLAVIQATTDKVNITDLYQISLTVKDRLGNFLDGFTLYVNGSEYTARNGVVETLLEVGAYELVLPDQKGFKFYAFSDGYNEPSRVVELVKDFSLTAEYRVPTTIEFEARKVFSISSLTDLFSFLTGSSERVMVDVTGVVVNYYGYGLPDRPLILKVTNLDYNYTGSYNITTDISGYFKKTLELMPDKRYEIEVVFPGDDVYVETASTTEITPAELPAAPPTVMEIPLSYIIIGIVGLIVVVVIVVAVLRASRHVISEISESRKRYVTRKRWVKRHGSA